MILLLKIKETDIIKVTEIIQGEVTDVFYYINTIYQ